MESSGGCLNSEERGNLICILPLCKICKISVVCDRIYSQRHCQLSLKILTGISQQKNTSAS